MGFTFSTRGAEHYTVICCSEKHSLFEDQEENNANIVS